MNKVKRNTKRFKLVMTVRIIAIILAVVNLYLLLSGKFSSDDIPAVVQKDSTLSHSERSQPNLVQTEDSLIVNTPASKVVSTMKTKDKKSDLLTSKEIRKLLQYQGSSLQGAYFEVANCSSCTSSVTGTDGMATATIPRQLIENDKEYDFYVYHSDTLMYHKSMRFSDLQFNTYR